jgi:hypothetical protein
MDGWRRVGRTSVNHSEMVVVCFVETEAGKRSRLWSDRRLQPRGLEYPGQYVQSKVAQELVIRVNDLPAGRATGDD